MSFKSFSFVRTFLAFLGMPFLFFCSPTAACWDAVPLELNATAHLGGIEAGQSLKLQVEVPSPGTLTILATAPLGSPAPALAPTKACEPDRSGSFKVVGQRSLRQISLSVDDGLHVFRVAGQDLLAPLSRVDIKTIFVASASIEGEEDPGEVEVDPDPFQRPHTSRKQLSGGCHSIEGEEDPGEVEVDPDPFHGGDLASMGRRWVLPETDSSQLWMVSIDTAGRWTELSDQRGQGLEVSNDGIKRLLLPGTYFVKTDGDYDLRTGDAPSLQASPW